jgi:hypothetical protein
MPESFQVTTGGGNITLERHPDQCPICHSKIAPMLRMSGLCGQVYKGHLEVIYSCPNVDCGEFFIGYFDRDQTNVPYKLNNMRPLEPRPLTFSDPVKDICQNYCRIYEEAHKAEQFGLTEICGVGYRKALEFLIKDYLIKQRPEDTATIERSMLGSCIENYVSDPRIKEVAKRATWLGNDETHYQRRWLDKDLSDLKTLIRLVIHWVEAEYLTEEALKSMPVPAQP